MKREDIVKEVNTNGYVIVENVLSSEFIARAKKELEAAIDNETKNLGPGHKDFGMVMICSLYGGAFIDLFNNDKLMEPFNAVLGDGCVVYAYTSSSMPPHKTNYSNRIHVDCPRIIPGYVTNMGATILLDDFTEENGATYFLPQSQNKEEAPTEEYFRKHSKRLIAKAGSVWFFNARVWHSGGNNLTDKWRHALTINMCRSYMKQRIDLPRAMAHMDLSRMSDKAAQKLGFHTQVPASLQEYYLPAELRKYKQKAE